MPFEITFPDLPAGYLADTVQEGEQAVVTVREFSSSEDGDIFITRLEGIPSQIIGLLPKDSGIRSSMVDHLLAIIRRDKTATIYVNEVPILTDVIIKGRDLKAGDLVYADDIADIRKVRFPEIEIPNDAGILYLFSEGWRKGLFFDFGPLSGEKPQLRNYDVSTLLAQYYAYLGFQRLFKLTDDDWNMLLNQQWFPFISLKKGTLEDIISYAANGWLIDQLTDRIAGEVTSMIPGLLRKWEKNKLFKPHFALFKQAAERFTDKDYISAASILYPRIEGVMRTHHMSYGQRLPASQDNLVKSVLQARASERHALSLLLPANFRRYLTEVYFANFDPADPRRLSRNTVSHGVAPAQSFSMKGAVIGLLILDQLSFYIGTEGEDSQANGQNTTSESESVEGTVATSTRR